MDASYIDNCDLLGCDRAPVLSKIFDFPKTTLCRGIHVLKSDTADPVKDWGKPIRHEASVNQDASMKGMGRGMRF